eukprot:36714-Hanusia_phi.AAC.1
MVQPSFTEVGGGMNELIVGKDVSAETGMRVVSSAMAREWEAKHLEASSVSADKIGIIEEVREAGGLCMVRWEGSKGLVPYATGLMRRYFLLVAPDVRQEAWVEEEGVAEGHLEGREILVDIGGKQRRIRLKALDAAAVSQRRSRSAAEAACERPHSPYPDDSLRLVPLANSFNHLLLDMSASRCVRDLSEVVRSACVTSEWKLDNQFFSFVAELDVLELVCLISSCLEPASEEGPTPEDLVLASDACSLLFCLGCHESESFGALREEGLLLLGLSGLHAAVSSLSISSAMVGEFSPSPRKRRKVSSTASSHLSRDMERSLQASVVACCSLVRKFRFSDEVLMGMHKLALSCLSPHLGQGLNHSCAFLCGALSSSSFHLCKSFLDGIFEKMSSMGKNLHLSSPSLRLFLGCYDFVRTESLADVDPCLYPKVPVSLNSSLTGGRESGEKGRGANQGGGGASVSSLTLFLLNACQSSDILSQASTGSKEVRRRSREAAGEGGRGGEEEEEEDSRTRKGEEEQIEESSNAGCKYFFDRVLQRMLQRSKQRGQVKDAELKGLFDLLMQDLFLLLFYPEVQSPPLSSSLLLSPPLSSPYTFPFSLLSPLLLLPHSPALSTTSRFPALSSTPLLAPHIRHVSLPCPHLLPASSLLHLPLVLLASAPLHPPPAVAGGGGSSPLDGEVA